MALLQPQDVRIYLNLSAGQDEQLLLALCAAAESFVLSQISMDSLEVTAKTEVYNGNGSDRMTLDRRPVVEITEVMIDGQVIPPATDWKMAGYLHDGYQLYVRGHRFSPNIQNVRISYTAGYSPIPEDLKRAAVDIVAEKYSRRLRQGVTSKSIGTESISYGQNDVTPFAKQVFGHYKRPLLSRL